VSAEPAEHNIEVFQGAYWTETILWKDSAGDPVDVSGYTARMQVRRTFENETPELELTTTNGRITLGLIEDPPGTPLYNILLEIEATATAALEATFSDRRWRYDLELVPAGGQVRRLMMGKFKVSLEVTR
jgi:hypothetical protein